MGENGITLEVSAEAQAWLADQGFDPLLGARPLKRAIQKYLESPLAKEVLQGTFKMGDTVLVEKGAENGLTFNKKPAVVAEISTDAPAEEVAPAA
jgi:ATP-dependent Clp protease ATP-binding subunit ClpA